MGRRKRRIITAPNLLKGSFALLLAFSTAAVGMWLGLESLLRWKMLNVSSRKLGVSVTAEEGGFDMREGKVRAKDIIISSPPDFKEPHIIRLGKVELIMDPFAWFKRIVIIDKIQAWNVDVRVEIQDHATNFMVLADNVRKDRGDYQGPGKEFVFSDCVLYDTAISVVDRDKARYLFTEMTIIADKIALSEGVPEAFDIRIECKVGDEGNTGDFFAEGRMGPITDTLNFKVSFEVKGLDMRHFKPCFSSDPKGIFRSNYVNIKGTLVCREDQVDGTDFMIKAPSTGIEHRITLEGPIDEPRMTRGSTIANYINFPFQKFMRMFRIFNPFKKRKKRE